MPHIAEIENNVVKRVIVVLDNYNGLTPEEWVAQKLGGKWILCSYSGSIRKNYPGPGWIYDEIIDAFIPPKTYASWILDKRTGRYKPPFDKPQDGKIYRWDEDITNWKET